MEMVNDNDGDSNNDSNDNDSNSNDDSNNNSNDNINNNNRRSFDKNDKKLTKIDEIYQDSENPVIHNGPKSSKIAPVSQN